MTQTRMGWGKVKFPGKRPLGVKKSSLWQNLEDFVMFSILNFLISGDSASYFLGIIMLINLLGTLAQTGVEVGM